jgi:peptidoglycan/LPS O-acetylase OafA/YrhL
MPEPVSDSQRYLPGLDGLRALAVGAVVAYHLDLGWAQGGLLGVGVFFTLSGYLITDLLIGQYERTGGLRLADFWLRRARRLLPALFVMLTVVVAWVTLLDRSLLPAVRGAVGASVVYVTNWWLIAQHSSYFAQFAPPTPLGHLWSLAVEEQFYLIWPWLLWLGLRWKRTGSGSYQRLAAASLLLAVASAVAMALLYRPGYDPTRVYDGTDTRASALLIGAALAFVWPSTRLPVQVDRRTRWALEGAGVAGLAVFAVLVWRTSAYSPFLYRGGLVLLSFATALMVAAAASPASLFGRILGGETLRWLGVRSYGIYLWHFPIIVLTTPAAGGDTPSRRVLQLAAIIGCAALSWRFIEEPIRRGGLSTWWAQIRRNRGGLAPLDVPDRQPAGHVGERQIASRLRTLFGKRHAGVGRGAAPGLRQLPEHADLRLGRRGPGQLVHLRRHSLHLGGLCGTRLPDRPGAGRCLPGSRRCAPTAELPGPLANTVRAICRTARIICRSLGS